MQHQLEAEIFAVNEQYQLGNISKEEHDYILLEIRDVRAAQECAGNETVFRHIVQCCNIAMKLM